MDYILEIYYNGECLEQRHYDTPFTAPMPGERIYFPFENKYYTEQHGTWWIVRKREHLMFSTTAQTLMLHCEPTKDEPNGKV